MPRAFISVAPLDAYERWMVKSNIEAIRKAERTGRGLTAQETIDLLRLRGYDRIARAVKKALDAQPE